MSVLDSRCLGVIVGLMSLTCMGCPGPGGSSSVPQGDTVVPPATCSDSLKNQGESDIDCGGPCQPCAVGSVCAQLSDCQAPALCIAAVCDLGLCDNNAQDPGEEGVDCGGDCRACLGGSCTDDDACASLFCDGGTCATPSCTDGVMNGGEAGVDCGAGCPGCPDGTSCANASDCGSGVCVSGTCETPAPSCDDGTRNGAETDIDCGGGACPGCNVGASCTAATDCLSTLCESGACTAAATCNDGLVNGTETGVDCGGGGCTACASGAVCAQDNDCLSAFCLFGQCTAPTCTDTYQNGTESDVDCGGSCPGCAVGAACETATDCTSSLCTDGACVDAPASCSDGLKNGDESAVDCGGDTCPKCNSGLACVVAADCLSDFCQLGQCTNPSCTDGATNGEESDVDCGGSMCDACPLTGACGVDTDCDEGVCVAGTCAFASCSDSEKNQGESDIDCGGANCPTCADGLGCGSGTDCVSLSCSSGTCQQATCSDGIANQGELGIDCAGPCALCANGVASQTPQGCESGVSSEGVCAVDYLQVEIAGDQFCGIVKGDGSIRCWPDASPSLAMTGSGFTHIALGVTVGPTAPDGWAPDRICALTDNGTAVCNKNEGIPSTVRFKKLVLGDRFACGLTRQYVQNGGLIQANLLRCYGVMAPVVGGGTTFTDIAAMRGRLMVFAQKSTGRIEVYGDVEDHVIPGPADEFLQGSMIGGLQALSAVYSDGLVGVKFDTKNIPGIFETDLDGYTPPFSAGVFYKSALVAVTQEIEILFGIIVYDPPTGPATQVWHGRKCSCSKHGEGAFVACWGFSSTESIQPPTQ